MKKLALLPLIILGAAGIDTAHAADLCYWYPNMNDQQTRIENARLPASTRLYEAAIGKSMAVIDVSITPLIGDIEKVKCAMSVPRVRWQYSDDGKGTNVGLYDNVHKTNLPGVGIHIAWERGLSGSGEYENSPTSTVSLSRTARLVLVRTAREVAGGNLQLNHWVKFVVNGWTAAEVGLVGQINLINSGYFSGCTGVKMLDLPMGRVMASELGQQEAAQNFNLDVLCSGLPAGSKLPVKVYFEGSSDGPGRLNLTPGGAKGVEIALTTDNPGVKLPFTKADALGMKWIRSEPKGELFRLPIRAQYVRKGKEPVGGGKANAVLNYILEYN
ncbi:fimbrial protein [Pseudomonas citronellolis]|uniref:fimbrial protein n=1 Tax=Pseudomonas citronellolis TaxID=53408 RepID=UPI00248E2E2B|nr:hypothetical protein [Pseudomonas citronellolis]